MTIVDIPIVFGAKPYSSQDDPDLPSNVRKMSPSKRRQWVHVFNGELAAHGDEGRAFASANSVAGHKEANRTGVMLALYPRPGVARKLAISAGEPPDDLHITLLYFGDAVDLDEASLYTISIAAEQVASIYSTFTAELGGIGRFYTTDEDGNQAFYASVDAPCLPALRQDLALRTAGLFKDNHGFLPHMTLAYVKEGGKNPIESWIPIKVKFDSLHLMVAGIEKSYPLAATSSAS